MSVKLHQIIVNSARKGLILQKPDGSFPKGSNGPWEDNDTYVRTTAHWALLMHKAYKITNENVFKEASFKACDYISLPINRPYNQSFYCREGSKKNNCNGLVGQAWAVEPLIIIGIEEQISSYVEIAREVVYNHQYSAEKHLWHQLEINGDVLNCHRTVNQQIWFSTMVLMLAKKTNDDYLKNIAEDFFENITSILEYDNHKGLVKHEISFDPLCKKIIKKIIRRNETERIRELSLGYLSFILHALAIAYKTCPEYEFWKNEKLRKTIFDSLKFVNTNYPYGFLEKDNSYRWSYNPVGIEIAFALETFDSYVEETTCLKKPEFWLAKQIQGYYDFEANLMNINTTDPAILSSRLYETYFLKNYNLEI